MLVMEFSFTCVESAVSFVNHDIDWYWTFYDYDYLIPTPLTLIMGGGGVENCKLQLFGFWGRRKL